MYGLQLVRQLGELVELVELGAHGLVGHMHSGWTRLGKGLQWVGEHEIV
ncbi:MAG: hypothetical protein HQL69_22995 [Magnetococcales bacterium]|nr:hypothetical protein [Magnetococcales bacterium]